MMCCGPRHVARVGVLAAVLLQAATAGELPRVFLTPAERAAVTANRVSGRPQPFSSTAPAMPAAEAPRAAESTAPSSVVTVRRPLRIDGVTFGAATPQAVWIAGERIADGGYWSGQRVQVLRDGVRLTAADGRVRRLRVGMEVPP